MFTDETVERISSVLGPLRFREKHSEMFSHLIAKHIIKPDLQTEDMCFKCRESLLIENTYSTLISVLRCTCLSQFLWC